MKLLHKIHAVVTKEVADENEAKMRSVVMRVFLLIFILYFLMQTILMSFSGIKLIPMLSFVLLILHCLLFYCTYLNKTNLAVLAIQLLTYFWIVGYVYVFGWNCGTQHFLFVLLIFSFMSNYYGIKVNLLLALLYFCTRLFLYFFTKTHAPIYSLDSTSSVLFQILNTTAIYLEITFLIYSFSKESISSEKKLVSYNRKIKELASVDPLTGLKNRRAMTEYLTQKISDAGSEAAFCIAISDIDLFKKVNDTYGHEAGDEVLKHISHILADYMKPRGTVARWGGEEFLFFFKNDNGDEVFTELDKLRRDIAKSSVTVNEQDISVTMTFGMQEYTSYKPIDYTISQADKKLYQGKTDGRNRVVF